MRNTRLLVTTIAIMLLVVAVIAGCAIALASLSGDSPDGDDTSLIAASQLYR